MSLEEVNWLTVIISIVTSGAFSAIIAGSFTLINGNLQRTAERQRTEHDRLARLKHHTRELALTLALEEWRNQLKLSESGQCSICTPNIFVFRYFLILTKMEENTLDTDAMSHIQEEVMNLSLAIDKTIKEYRKKNNLTKP